MTFRSALVWRNRSLVPLAAATIATGLTFYVSVSALFLTARGQSLADIFIFESILLAAILSAEIPAGLVADRVNRRWIIFAGFLLNAVAEMLFALGDSFGAFALSFAISGFGIAMLTGVQDAYIYDSLGENADRDSVEVWGHLSALELGAGVIGSSVGGLLATVNLFYPAFAAAITAFFAAAIVLFLPGQRAELDSERPESSYLALKRGLILLVTSPILLYTAAASSAVFVLFNAVFTLNQPLFQVTGVSVGAWGFIGAGAQLAAAGYNYFAGALTHRVGRRLGLLIAMGYGVLGFALMAVPHPIAVVVGFILVVVGKYARGPITMSVANRVIPKNRRATVLNIASTIGSLIGIGMNPLIGWGAEQNPTITVGTIAAVLLVFTLTWIPVANRYLVEEPNQAEDTSISLNHISCSEGASSE